MKSNEGLKNRSFPEATRKQDTIPKPGGLVTLDRRKAVLFIERSLNIQWMFDACSMFVQQQNAECHVTEDGRGSKWMTP